MDWNDLYESVQLLCKCVSDKSSEKEKITVLEDLKPSSFAWIIECTLDYIEQHK